MDWTGRGAGGGCEIWKMRIKCPSISRQVSYLAMDSHVIIEELVLRRQDELRGPSQHKYFRITMSNDSADGLAVNEVQSRFVRPSAILSDQSYKS